MTKEHAPSSNVNNVDYPRRTGLPTDPIEPLAPSMRVLLKNDHYVVLDKPHDVRLDGDFDRSIEKLVKQRFPDVDVLKMVHRLDYATSGCLCMARNRKACGRAGRMFEQRKTIKVYTALLSGHITQTSEADRVLPIVHPSDEGILDSVPDSFKEYAQKVLNRISSDANIIVVSAPIATALNDPTHFRMEVGSTDEHKDKKEAVTIIECQKEGFYYDASLQDNIACTLVKMHLVTGRRHQLRVHCQYAGFPIVGDFTYGTGSDVRMMLHAQRLLVPIEPPIDVDTGDIFAPHVRDQKFEEQASKKSKLDPDDTHVK